MHAPDPPARRGRTPLPSGRALAWSEWGAEDGAPVLFSPGAATSSWLGFADGALLARTRARIVAIDRPGLGRSDPDPSRSLGSFAEDVRELARTRGLGAPPIVGHSQGAPFALACAASGVVRAAAIVAGTDELASTPDALVPDVRRLVELAVRDPDAAEAMFRTMTADAMHRMVVSMIGPADRAVYADAAFDAAYRRALEEAFAQGPDGYARDTALAMGAWGIELGSIAVPVDLWYGEADTSPVHSPDLGASLARRVPGARRFVVAGAGGALLWTHAEPILAALLAHG